MAKKSIEKRLKPDYHILIEFPDGKKISKSNLLISQLFNIYFINLDKNLSVKKYSIHDADSIMNKYDELFKNCKVKIQYTDSWGHRWKGKEAWPRREKFINYLKERILNYETYC